MREPRPARRRVMHTYMEIDLKTYRIPVEWTVYGYMDVEAASLQDAVEHACDDEPLPAENEYLDGTFRVDAVNLHAAYPDEEVTIPDECAG